MTAEEYKRILANYLPATAVDRVYDFLNHFCVHFHITRQRTSKLGDYRWPQPRHNFQEISVNGDLNPYEFLMVLLHEMAHLLTHQRYDNHVQPHGHEWQDEYRNLLSEYLDCFPQDVAQLIGLYVRRLPLNHRLGNDIDVCLKRYDANRGETPILTLNNLAPGTCFHLKAKPQHHFRAIEKRRTRWMCEDLASGQKYLVNGSAEVERDTV